MKDLNHYKKQLGLFLLDVGKRLDPSVTEEPTEEEVLDLQLPESLLSTTDGEPDSASSEPTQESTPSLLDNQPYMALAHQCRDMLQELDRMAHLVPDASTRSFIEQQQSRIAEALFLSGATPIAEESTFNLLRHEPAEGGVITNGTPIAETLTPGIEIEGQVLVKAKVKLEKEETV